MTLLPRGRRSTLRLIACYVLRHRWWMVGMGKAECQRCGREQHA